MIDERYEPIKAVGKGAYGVVCSAHDGVTGEKVAIKKITNAFENIIDARRTLREMVLLRYLRWVLGEGWLGEWFVVDAGLGECFLFFFSVVHVARGRTHGGCLGGFVLHSSDSSLAWYPCHRANPVLSQHDNNMLVVV